MKKFVDTNNSRAGQYRNVIADIAKKGVCPFCPDQLKQFHKNPILTRKYWIVTDNMYPYHPVLQHLLLIHRKHIKHASEISVGAWQELSKIIKEVSEKRDISGGTFILRFGDTHFTGSSVSHLHAHLIQSSPESDDYDKKKGIVTRIG